MVRVLAWKTLAVIIALTLVAAGISFAAGNTILASSLIVVTLVEGVAYAILLTIGSLWRRRRAGAAANR